jgi:hypothetical protein
VGLIDTLTGGFRIVQRRPWLVLLPLVADLWLWLGPQLAVQSLVDGLLALWSPANLPPDLGQVVGPYRELLTAEGAHFNLWWLLSNSLTWLRLVLPGLVDPAELGTAALRQVPTLSLILWVPLLLVLGLGIGSAFLTAVASQLRVLQPPREPADAGGPAPSMGFWVRRGLRTWGVATVYGALLAAMLLAAMLLLSLALAPILMVAPQVGSGLTTLLALLIGWLMLWLYFMLYFVVAALVVDGIGLGQALWRSFNVVGRNFWPTLGLVLLTTVILAGFGFIWQRLAAHSPGGMLVAIAGNALLLTGLTAARLLFYKDRSERWLATQPTQPSTAHPPAP